MTWRRGCESAHCIEVDTADPTVVKIRDSKDPDGPVLLFDFQEWNDFKEGIRNGAFD